MKRLGMLLILVSVSMFTLVGCGETKKKTTPPADKGKTEASAEPKADAPAPPAAPAGETKPEEKKP
jgi:hypothetical protein